MIENFPDANVPEELPGSVDPSPTDILLLESHDCMLEPASISDEGLPGSTPSRRGSTGSNSVSRSLLMETPVTAKECISTSPHATVHGNNSTPLSNNSTSSSACTSPTSNVISKYLVQYIPPIVEKKKAAEMRITGSRVLTSAEGLALLREKEEKKKKEKEKGNKKD